MTTKCSIVPQIWHLGNKVDSLLFTQLWDYARTLTIDAVEARSKARDLYYSSFGPAFIAEHGDWVTQYKTVNNVLGENDFRNYKPDVKITLDEYGEPLAKDVIEFKPSQNALDLSDPSNITEDYYIPKDESELTYTETAFFNRIFSSIIVASLDDTSINDNTVNKSGIKKTIISKLKNAQRILLKSGTDAATYNADNIQNIVDRLSKRNSKEWKYFVGYFANKFNTKITYNSAVELDDSFRISSRETPRTWDDQDQLKMNMIDTISSRVKFELARSIYGDKHVAVYVDENVDPNESTSAKYGLKNVLDLDQVWHQIIGINYNNSSKESILTAIDFISDRNFNGLLKPFIKKLADDNIFFNLFQRTTGLAITPNMTMTIDKSSNVENNDIKLEYKTNNKDVHPDNIAYNIITKNINNRLLNRKVAGEGFNPIEIIDINIKYKESESLQDKFDILTEYAVSLGIELEPISILYYLNLKTNRNTSAIDIKNHLIAIDSSFGDITDKHLEDSRVVYEREFNNLKDKLAEIANGILRLYGKDITGAMVKPGKRLNWTQGYKKAVKDIAYLTLIQYADKVNMSYLNSSGEREYSPQFSSFITDLFKGLVSNNGTVASKDLVFERFKDYTTDPRLDHDNILWDEPNGTQGIFKYTIDGNGKKQPVNVNTRFLSKFTLTQIGGQSDVNSNNGINYRDIKDDNWNYIETISILKGTFLLPSSDGSRIYGINKEFVNYQDGISINSWHRTERENDNLINGILNAQELLNDDSFISSTLYTHLSNIFEQEFTDIALTLNKLFDEDGVLNGKYNLKEEFKGENISKLAKGIEVNLVDGKYSAKLANGKPSGNVFTKTNFSYVDETGKVQTLKSYIEANHPDVNFDYYKEIVLRGKNKSRVIDKYKFEFIAKWLEAKQRRTIDTLLYIKEDLLNSTHPTFRKQEDRNRDMSTTDETRENESFDIKPTIDIIPRVSEEKSQEVDDASFNIAALNIFANEFINSVSFGNLFSGSIVEYKNAVDENKRVIETITIGASTNVNEEYRMLVMEDVMLEDFMTHLFDNTNNGTTDEIAAAKESFGKFINSTDGIDIITDVEFERRLKAFGTYDRYKSIIDDINNPDIPFNAKKYTTLVEQLKYYSYNRKLHNGRVVSYQNKNSTIVLFKRFVKGTEQELLYDVMIENNIHDINSASGNKVGDVIPFKLHNPDGSLNVEQFNNSTLSNSIITLNYKDLRIQLDTVPHIMDKQGRTPTQLIKKFLDGINRNTLYNVNGKPILGRTGLYEDGKRGLYEEFHASMAYNVEESAIELLHDFGAIVDGQIQKNLNGSIKIDIIKLRKMIEEDYMNSSTDLNILKAVAVQDDGTTAIPYHHPSLLKIIEAKLQSKITNKVTRQKLDNMHVPIAPNIFGNFIEKDSNPDTFISYTTSFLEESKRLKTNKLRSEYYDKGGNYHPAQILLNPHNSYFYQKQFLMDDGSGRPDINKIKAINSKALMVFGTRIPHEGDQSSFVAEIVGFLHTGASQAITPDHLIARTGWDFDIDTVYLYKYSLNKDLTSANINDTSTEAKENRLDNYIVTYYPKEYQHRVYEFTDEIKRLRNEIKRIGDLYDAEREKRIFAKYNNAIKNRLDIIRKTNEKYSIEGIEELIADYEATIQSNKTSEKFVNKEDTEKIINDYHNAQKELDRLQTLDDSILFAEFGEERNKDIRDVIATKVSKQKEYRAKIKELKLEIERYTKFKESVRPTFDTLDNIKQSTRPERNNNILDTFITVFNHKQNFPNKEKDNGIAHIKSASDYINNILGISTDNANMRDITDKFYFRNLNMNVATLKEHSVAYDNIIAIMNVLGGRNMGTPIPAIMKFSQFNSYDPAKGHVSLITAIEHNFGKNLKQDAYTIDYENETVTIHNIGYIGNNFALDGTDIQGEAIAKQRSELTANILDAVKQLMINLNNETFSIFAYLASTPLSYYTNIHLPEGATPETNRYIYPSLYVSQPIIQDISRDIMINSKFGDTTHGKSSVGSIKRQYIKTILDSFDMDTANNLSLTIEKHFFDLSTSYTPTEQDYAEYGRSSDETIVEDRTRFFKEMFDIIHKYNDSKNTNKNIDTKNIMAFITGLNHYFTSKGRSSIASRPFLLEELRDGILNAKDNSLSIDARLEYNIQQLSVLLSYETLSKASTNVTALMGIFKTDSLGTGPNSSKTNRFHNSVAKVETNYSNFMDDRKAHYKEVDNEIKFKELQRSIESAINGAVSITDKRGVILDAMEKEGYTPRPSAIQDSRGKNITRAVFGDLIDVNEPDPLSSAYPYLAAQAKWSNLLSTRMFGDSIITENPEVKTIINNALFRLGAVEDDSTRYKLVMNMINRNVSAINFFGNVNYNQLLGVVAPIIEETERQVEMKRNDFQTFKIKSIVYKMPTFEDAGYFKDDTISREEKISKFNTLSLANQIKLLDSIGTNTKFIKDRININESEDSLRKYGFVRIGILDHESDINESRDAFKDMFNSGNVFDRIVADNMIKYSFIINGLQFGVSISKFIPIDLMMDRGETLFNKTDRNRTTHDLHTVSDVMKSTESTESMSTDLTDQDIDRLHRSMWNNVAINPVMSPTYYMTKKGKQINKDLPSFTETLKGKNPNPLASHVIIEPIDRVNESKYALNEYLIKNIPMGEHTVPVLFKRHDRFLGSNYLYYPISRALAFEYGETAIDNFKTIPIDGFPQTIVSADDYIDVIHGSNIKGVRVNTDEISVKSLDGSYSVKVKELGNQSDAIIHIGSESTFEGKVSKASHVNTIVITEAEFNKGIDLSGISPTITIEKAKALADTHMPIPQNIVSGQRLGTNIIEASDKVKTLLGNNPKSIDMIEAGLRTRTTRSDKEFGKYNVKIGDFIWQEGYGKKILTQVTTIYTRRDPKFKSNWHLEGWTDESFNEISKSLTTAIEFKVVKSNNDLILTNFQGYKGGFENTGKGTPQGDGKDKAMRLVADGFIGESQKAQSSTTTSFREIKYKLLDKYKVPAGNGNIAFELQDKFDKDFQSYIKDGIKGYISLLDKLPKIVMLARNSEFKNIKLNEHTKDAIITAYRQGAEFVVGDMPNVDSQFIDYLQEIGAKFTIYHTGTSSRININTKVESNKQLSLFDNESSNSTSLILTILGDSKIINPGAFQNALRTIATQANISTINTIAKGESTVGDILSKTSIPGVKINVNQIKEQNAVQLDPTETVEFGTETSKETMASIMDSIQRGERDILATAIRLRTYLAQNTPREEMLELINIAKKAKELHDSLTSDASAKTLTKMFETNNLIFDFLWDQLMSTMKLVRDTNTKSFFGKNKGDVMLEYGKRLNLAYDYIRAIQHLVNMPKIDPKNVANLTEKDFDIINKYMVSVEWLEKTVVTLNPIFDEIMTRINDHHATEIIRKSTNDNYRESLYSKARTAILAEGYTPEEIGNFKITPSELTAVVRRMLENNEDIGFFASQLDSARDTGITLPDVMGKVYAEALLRSHAHASRQLTQFNNILDKAGIKKDKKFNSTRAVDFKTKFTDKNGDLISMFKYDNFQEEIANLNALLTIEYERRGTAYIARDVVREREALGRINVIKARIKALATETEIGSATTEYAQHFDFYKNSTEKQQRQYEADNNIKFRRTPKSFKIYNVIPADQFLSEEYSKLSDTDKQFVNDLRVFLKTMVSDVFSNHYMSNKFLPYSFQPTFTHTLLATLGINMKVPENVNPDLNNERQFFAQSNMLKAPTAHGVYNIPPRIGKELTHIHTARVLSEINAVHTGVPFTSIEQIKAYNKERREEALQKALPYRNMDIVNLMHLFINDMKRVKTVLDFEPTYRMMLITLGSDKFIASEKKLSGGNIIDKVSSWLAGKTVTVNKRGKQTRVYKRIVDQGPAIYGISRIQTDMDVLANALIRGTSLVTMGFNFRTGVKNVVAGYVNVITESMASEYYGKDHLTIGTGKFVRAIPQIFRDVEKDTTDNKTVAFIKFFGDLFVDKTEAHADVNPTMFSNGLKLWETAAYISINAGEYFLQFSTMLSMLESHRYVGNEIMTESDFVGDRRYKVAYSLLSTEQKASLTSYKNTVEKNRINSTDFIDIIGDWLANNNKDISNELKTKIDKVFIAEVKMAKEQFKSFSTLESLFDLDLETGKIKVKEGIKFGLEKQAMFMDRVRTVNHSLQGVYNPIDRNVLQNAIVGEVFMQFRKWMRPTFIRWFGAKYGKTTYSEAMGNYRAGAYSDFYKALTQPGREGLRAPRGNGNVIIEAAMNIARGYMDYIQNASYYYNRLPKHQQANVRRVLHQILAMGTFTVLLSVAYAAGGGDDKKKNGIAANAIYQLSAIQTELFETSMAGWVTFYLRTKKSIVPIERTLSDLFMFFYYSIMYPFVEEDKSLYQTGIYKGEAKAMVKFKNVVPGLRQIQSQTHLSNTINYYQMYNPIYNLFGINKDKTDIKPQTQSNF